MQLMANSTKEVNKIVYLFDNHENIKQYENELPKFFYYATDINLFDDFSNPIKRGDLIVVMDIGVMGSDLKAIKNNLLFFLNEGIAVCFADFFDFRSITEVKTTEDYIKTFDAVFHASKSIYKLFNALTNIENRGDTENEIKIY